ncbi:hypothetical protein MSP7336_01790 [Mycobacterium shimoidei]|uniref:Uncharacterized protein n=1 Tax=Mycobacterium shimoidei TaxID=29313 RepID=A0A375YXJ7_MYCSH|nr:hypothetical protein [Mycobacterium shimoidei]SRX93552.1 hypothetical protein MSP7336_01790 [Mycobacterium shimoidei]
MFSVKTKGRIIGLNPDLMKLLSSDDGTELVTATRVDGIWTIQAEGQEDVTAQVRSGPDGAIRAMLRHAAAVTGEPNYTAQSEPGLDQLP